MDWITGIQKAIDYVEAHITEPIDYEEAAKRAYSSSFHFQRVFSILCGFTLGEYIRWRRLSLAGSELLQSNEKIIDLAMKYGYDTPESFSRAFTRFHGIAPSQAKNNSAVLKSFSRLSVKLILNGGNTMDYRIETKEAFKLIMKKKKVSRSQELTAAEIGEFWKKCGSDGTIESLCKYIPEENIFKDCIVGASFGKDATDEEFPYAIGAMYNGLPVEEEDLIVEEIPAHTYVYSHAWERCRNRSRNCISRFTVNFSHQVNTSPAEEPTSRHTRRQMSIHRIIIVKSGSRLKRNKR